MELEELVPLIPAANLRVDDHMSNASRQPSSPLTISPHSRTGDLFWSFFCLACLLTVVTDAVMSETVAPVSADNLRYVQWDGAKEDVYLPCIRELISKELSEPYSIYVYRYFLYQWGDLCYMALDPSDKLIGVVVSKLELHNGGPLRGYIAMLATQTEYRGRGIATKLVSMAIQAMIDRDADEIALETEVTNTASLRLYEKLGFIRSKRLHRYYLNGETAFRLILYVKPGTALKPTFPPQHVPYDDGKSEGRPAETKLM